MVSPGLIHTNAFAKKRQGVQVRIPAYKEEPILAIAKAVGGDIEQSYNSTEYIWYCPFKEFATSQNLANDCIQIRIVTQEGNKILLEDPVYGFPSGKLRAKLALLGG